MDDWGRVEGDWTAFVRSSSNCCQQGCKHRQSVLYILKIFLPGIFGYVLETYFTMYRNHKILVFCFVYFLKLQARRPKFTSTFPNVKKHLFLRLTIPFSVSLAIAYSSNFNNISYLYNFSSVTSLNITIMPFFIIFNVFHGFVS